MSLCIQINILFHQSCGMTFRVLQDASLPKALQRSNAWRDHSEHRLDQDGHVIHQLAELIVGFRIGDRMAHYFAGAFRHDRPISRDSFHPAVESECSPAEEFPSPCRGKSNSRTTSGRKKTDYVRGNGIFESWKHFFGDGGATNEMTLFQHRQLSRPAFSEICSSNRPLWPPPIMIASY